MYKERTDFDDGRRCRQRKSVEDFSGNTVERGKKNRVNYLELLLKKVSEEKLYGAV